MRTSRFARLLIALMVVLLALLPVTAGCGKLGSGGKKIVYAMGTEPKKLDAQDVTDNPSYIATSAVYDNLVAYDENMHLVPRLATSWEPSADGLTWTFHLRQGVKFQDGTPFNAKAVKVTFDRILDPNLKLARYGLYSAFMKSVDVVDDYTVKFNMKMPFGALPQNLAHPAGVIISPAALQKYGKDIARHPVGTGPFMFKEWVSGDHITMVKNPNYWGDKPKIDTLVFKFVPEANTRLTMLETGEADVAYPIAAADVQNLKNSDKINLIIKPTNRLIYIGMNVKKPPFNNQKVRQALNYAVNKQAIVDKILLGLGDVALSPLGPNNWGYAPQQPYEYNPDKAKQLLKEAGVKPGTTVKLWTPDGRYLMDRQTAEAVQADLQAVGLKVEFQKWEWTTYLDELDKLDKGSYEMFLLGWAPSTGDADWGLRPLFQTGSSDNNCLYSNKAVDELIQKGMSATNETERLKIYADLQKAIWDDAPVIFLYSLKQTIGVRKNVTGLIVHPLEMLYFNNIDKQ